MRHMNTNKTISVTEFRQKLFDIVNDIYFNKSSYVVMKNNIPLIHVTSIPTDVKTQVEKELKPKQEIKEVAKTAKDESKESDEDKLLALLLAKLKKQSD